jgi:MoaA/NifB/PqqE/SkfB family radical SAM enzyme
MSCARCFGHLEGFHDQQMMNLKIAQAATQLYFEQRALDCKNPYIMLFGGEPLTNLDLLYQFIPWVQQEYEIYPFRLCLFTNGLALTEELLIFFQRHKVLLFVSLDGSYDIQRKSRDITTAEYDHIVSMIRKTAEADRDSIVPYCVINHGDSDRVFETISYIAALKVDKIAVSKNMEELWGDSDRLALIDMLKQLRRKLGIMILLYPEMVSDCITCNPKSMMVYPNGEIKDLCYTCSSIITGNGTIEVDDNRVMHLGHIEEQPELLLDVKMKRKIIKLNMQCSISDGKDPAIVSELATPRHPFFGLTA